LIAWSCLLRIAILTGSCFGVSLAQAERGAKAAFARLTADFDDVTAPFIVVRKQWDMDEQYDAQMKKLDAAIKTILTDEQRRMLESKAN